MSSAGQLPFNSSPSHQQSQQQSPQQSPQQSIPHSISTSALKLEGEVGRKKEFQVNLMSKKPQQATQQAYESLKKNADFRSQFKLPHSETIFEGKIKGLFIHFMK